MAVREDRCTGDLLVLGLEGWKARAYGHDPLECTRVWSLVYAEAPESIVVPQVIDAESGELGKTRGQERQKLYEWERRTSIVHTDHIPKIAGGRELMVNEDSKFRECSPSSREGVVVVSSDQREG